MIRHMGVARPILNSALSSRLRTSIIEAAYCLLLPIALYFIYRVSPINQIGFLDPWLYTGYIHNFDELFDRYGLPYYSVRFGLIVPHYITANLFGPVGGYFAGIYIFYLIAGVPLYLVTRKYFSVYVAAAAYYLLISSLWVARSLLWTHPDAAAVPYMIAATSFLYYQPNRYRRFVFFAIGTLVALAANCNIFTITISGLLIVPYLILYRGNLRFHIANIGWAILGFVAVFVTGAVSYLICCGTADFLRPTIAMIAWSMKGGSEVYKASVAQVLQNTYVYAPLYLMATLFVVRGQVSVSALRLIDAALAYIGSSLVFIIFWQFMLNGVVLEIFYYFCFLIPPAIYCMVLVPAILLSRGEGCAPNRLGFAAVVLIPMFLLSLHVYRLYDLSVISRHMVVAVYMMSIVTLMISNKYRLAPLTLIPFLVSLNFGWQTKAGTFDPFFYSIIGYEKTEGIDSYRASVRLMKSLPRFEENGEQLLFWYRNNSRIINSLQSTYLWGYSRLSSADNQTPGFPEIRDVEVTRLKSEAPLSLVLLSEDPADFSKARSILLKQDIVFNVKNDVSLCEGSVCVYASILSIQPTKFLGKIASHSTKSVVLYRGVNNDWQQNGYSSFHHLMRRLAKNFPTMVNPPSMLSSFDDRLMFNTSMPADHLATPLIKLVPANKGGSPFFSFEGDDVKVNEDVRCRATIQDEKYNILHRTTCSQLWVNKSQVTLAQPLPEKIRLVLDIPGGRSSEIPHQILFKQYFSNEKTSLPE
jgi:hypothetical protein